MAVIPHRPRARRWRTWPALGGPRTIALALTLFAAGFALRTSQGNVANADEVLYVIPVALLALQFGLRGGLAGGLLALGLVVGGDLSDSTAQPLQGYLSPSVAFLLLGALLGVFVDNGRRLEAQLSRYYEESLDLLATANLTGSLTRVNPAWERVLGHSSETLCSRPFIEFVHPDDRESTIAENTAISEGSRDAVRFRNRYRAADGSYRWLEWTARASIADGVIHAAARDISVQVEAEEQLANNAQVLEAMVAERTRDLEATRAETLQRLAYAGEYRDDDTFQHTERVGTAAAGIAARLGLGTEDVGLLGEAAPLHDIGKLAIPDGILLKPGPLTSQEREVMQTHAQVGARLLDGSSSPVLQTAAVIAASHHERWDGAGYPEGVAGEAIPLVGRIVAVADVFDALTHDRPYKSAWPLDEAIAEIEHGAGSQFDPCVVAAFLAIQKDAAVPTAHTAGPTGPSALEPSQRASGGLASQPA